MDRPLVVTRQRTPPVIIPTPYLDGCISDRLAMGKAEQTDRKKTSKPGLAAKELVGSAKI